MTTEGQGLSGQRRITTPPPRRRGLRPGAALLVLSAVVVAGGVAAGVVLKGGTAEDFSWFSAAVAPPQWQQAALPNGAVLAFPIGLDRVQADPGAVSAQRRGPGGSYLAYVNATPWHQAVPGDWASARLDHLREENHAVHEDGAASRLTFLDGARGSCVADHYLTDMGGHAFDEMACLVVAPTGRATVVVAAASTGYWSGAVPTLRQALESFRA